MNHQEKIEDKIFHWLLQLVIYGLFAVVFLLLPAAFVKGWHTLLR